MIWAAAWQNHQNDLCAQTQIRLGIHPVWSESSLSAHADSEDSDQTRRMPSLIWVFAWGTDHFVGFGMLWLFLIFWNSLTFFEEEKKNIYQPTDPSLG